MANSSPDPNASKSMIRRRLLSSATPERTTDADSVDFESLGGGSDGIFRDIELLLQNKASSAPAPAGNTDEVEALIQRYHAEKSLETPLSELRRSLPELRGPGGSNHGRPGGGRGLPPLTTTTHAELERLRTENTELRQLVEEYRIVFEANDPEQVEQQLADNEQGLLQRDEEIAALKAQIEEWETKLQTHRFVPQEDELAQWADEIDKERSQLAQEQKQLEEDRNQLKQDEEDLMKQMREMEVGMAKDRADLARQRTELQRLHAEIKHEMELMQRGDASLKERLAQFQRRYQDALTRPSGPPVRAVEPPAPLPSPIPAPASSPSPRDSTVFKKLFGQG